MYKIFLRLVGKSNDINPTFFDRLKKQQQKTKPILQGIFPNVTTGIYLGIL